MWRVILRNSLSPIVVQFSLGVGLWHSHRGWVEFGGVGRTAANTSLGIHPCWASDVTIMSVPLWLTAFPGLAIFITVLGFNFVGGGLREALDPHMRRI